MSKTAIRVQNVSKQYRIGGPCRQYKTLRESLVKAATRPFHYPRRGRNESSEPHTVWALNDVSFEVKQGEVVGIIGRNGAGKSTLLKVLSRITKPTLGRAEIYGRVGSLLEVGTGFHPELTGRENIYLNGTILGMHKGEIDRKFDEIVDFAEIERFLDTPVKHYSSGMYVRLAFAVAAHLNSEILAVDEVLAVGDVAFQEKCLGKMSEVATGGRTVLFVSHSMAAVNSLCRSAILLSRGEITAFDEVQRVTDLYLESAVGGSASTRVTEFRDRRGSGEVRIVDAAVLDGSGQPGSSFKHGDDIQFEFTLERQSPSPDLICVVWIKTGTGIPVLHLASRDDPTCNPLRFDNKVTVRCLLRDCRLYPGQYSVSLWTGPSHSQDTDFIVDALRFRMEQGELLSRSFDMTWRLGIFHSETTWTVRERAHTQ